MSVLCRKLLKQVVLTQGLIMFMKLLDDRFQSTFYYELLRSKEISYGMPRDYIRKTDRAAMNENNIKSAVIECVKNNLNVSKVTRQYRIKRTTLQSRLGTLLKTKKLDIIINNDSGNKSKGDAGNILSTKGTKQVGQRALSEIGILVTFFESINAVCTALPPIFVYPRTCNSSEYLSEGSPTGLQPLDVVIYAPFKIHLATAFNDWILADPGQTLTLRHIGHLSNKSYGLLNGCSATDKPLDIDEQEVASTPEVSNTELSTTQQKYRRGEPLQP
ncbi:hypothetical protein ILUMI_06214 [Ignelater luminosus]|uniref:HTH psq-type domain-containing protein n=1 Tax=Ignelater luminosus TaxID=2038154 RepID=A0A8K0GHY8_IGNLU|nr:hypothetical protein ILUMI_06214 [Ignelater luminosus]